MKVITTTYCPKTRRYRATDGDRNTVFCTEWGGSSYEDSYFRAALALCLKMNWRGKLVGGHVVKAGQNAGMVWVWIEEKRARSEVLTIPEEPVALEVLKSNYGLTQAS